VKLAAVPRRLKLFAPLFEGFGAVKALTTKIEYKIEFLMKNPIQPLEHDAYGVVRFKANLIVLHLLETHPSCDMNEIARREFSADDRQQFAQLIGYSLSGYSELQSVDDSAYEAAALMATGLGERDARIATLEQKLAEMRAAVDMMREPMARLLERPPEDLN
jgi:hypothetical protein